MNKQQLRDIVKADNARRAQRQQLEDAILGISLEPDTCSDAYKIAHSKPHSVANGCLVRPIGVVSSHTVRASERWTGTLGTEPFKSGRTVGTATPDSDVPTVKVIRNGIEEIVPASSFRSTRNTRNTRSTTAVAPQHRKTAADMPVLFAD